MTVMTQDQYNVLLQHQRNLHTRVDLLDFKTDVVINEIEGRSVDGDVTLDRNSSYRRVCNMTFVVDEDEMYGVGADKNFWVNRKIKLFIGIDDLSTSNIVWFDLGKYIIAEPTLEKTSEEHMISFESYDYMSMLDGTFSGYLNNPTELDRGISVTQAITSILKDLVGVTDIYIEPNNNRLPYTIKKDASDTIYDLLMEINNLHMDYEMFFDVDGMFVYRKIPNYQNMPVFWDFDDDDFNMYTGVQEVTDFTNVKNVQYVWGKQLEDGKQVKAIAKNTNLNHPYSIQNIGERHAEPYIDDKIFTNEQAELRALYELENKHGGEIVIFETPQLFILDVNDVIKYKDEYYLIDNMNFGLSYEGMMSIECHKIYSLDSIS